MVILSSCSAVCVCVQPYGSGCVGGVSCCVGPPQCLCYVSYEALGVKLVYPCSFSLSVFDEFVMFWGLAACEGCLCVGAVWCDGCGVCCVLEYEWSLGACDVVVEVVHRYRLGIDPAFCLGGV